MKFRLNYLTRVNLNFQDEVLVYLTFYKGCRIKKYSIHLFFFRKIRLSNIPTTAITFAPRMTVDGAVVINAFRANVIKDLEKKIA